MNRKSVWISWEWQRRSVVLADEFSCELFIYNKKFKNKISRYFSSIVATYNFVKKRNPEIIFCQNPSLILAVFLCILKNYYKYKLIVDRHSNFMLGASDSLKKRVFLLLSNYTIRSADVTIVTNRELIDNYINNAKGNGYILPDKIPNLKSIKQSVVDSSKKNVLFVTSFSVDEPISEFFQAIDNFDDNYFFYISGNYHNYKSIPLDGRNFKLTGFIGEEDYIALMSAVDVVVVLTKHDSTLTCGAYEAISLGKPMILSGTSAITAYFKKGAIYTDNSAESIRRSLIDVFCSYDALHRDVVALKYDLSQQWDTDFRRLVDSL